MIVLLFLIIFSSNIFAAGFASDTLLLTNRGQITFDKVDNDTLIQSNKNSFQPVLFLDKQFVEKIVHITVAGECIVCHKKQLFWCVNKSGWICAKDLFSGDLLHTIDNQNIAIDQVQIIQQQTEIYLLSVGPPHYLYVGKQKILAHNVAWFVGVAATFAFEAGVIEFIKGSFVVAIGFVVLKIKDHFAKNRDKKKPKITVSVQPENNGYGNFNPNDDDKNNKDKHERLIYEGAYYHRKCQSAEKSREPQNGQKALDNSFPIGGDTIQRVSVCNGEIVILKHTRNNIYHGYVVTWQDLNNAANKVSEAIKNILLKNNLVKNNGKII